MAEIQEAGRARPRRQVRRAAVRLQQPGDRRGGGLRRRPRHLHRRPARSRGRRSVEATSDNRIPLLVDGTVDLVLSTMTITEERDLEIDFSEPYYVANGDVLVPEDSDIRASTTSAASGVHDPRLDLPGHDREGGPGRRPEAGRPLLGVFDLIQTGCGRRGLDRRCDPHRDGDPGHTLEFLDLDYTTEPYGVGIPDGDTEMKEFVDESVAEFIDSGAWQDPYEEWVGQYIPRGPAAGSADDHPGGGAGAVPARVAGDAASLNRGQHRDRISGRCSTSTSRSSLRALGHFTRWSRSRCDRDGRSGPRRGPPGRAVEVAQPDRRDLRRDVSQHPAAGPPVHRLLGTSEGGGLDRTSGWRAIGRLGLYTAAYIAERCARASSPSARVRSRRPSHSASVPAGDAPDHPAQAFRSVIPTLGSLMHRDDQELGDRRRLARSRSMTCLNTTPGRPVRHGAPVQRDLLLGRLGFLILTLTTTLVFRYLERRFAIRR